MSAALDVYILSRADAASDACGYSTISNRYG